MNTAATLYESDFYGWTRQQADVIRAGNLARLDLDNLLEEIETMGRSEKNSLKSSLSVLLAHLVKWNWEPDHRTRSWKLTIEEQRLQVADILDDNPSLGPLLPAMLEKAWKTAKIRAEKETGINRAKFPQSCPWSFADIMNDTFWPEDST